MATDTAITNGQWREPGDRVGSASHRLVEP